MGTGQATNDVQQNIIRVVDIINDSMMLLVS